MNYTYELFVETEKGKPLISVDTSDKFHEVWQELQTRKLKDGDFVVQVTKSIEGNKVATLFTNDDLEMWQVKIEREGVWLPRSQITVVKDLAEQLPDSGTPGQTLGWEPFKEAEITMIHPVETNTTKPDAINPAHYQNFFTIEDAGVNLQWLEHMQYHKNYKDPEHFKAAVELQVRKYLDRNGGKDKEIQEVMKALWYLKFLAAFIKNGNKPIFVKDVETILKR